VQSQGVRRFGHVRGLTPDMSESDNSVLGVVRVVPMPPAPETGCDRPECAHREHRAPRLVALRLVPAQLHPHQVLLWPSRRRESSAACDTGRMPARIDWISVAPVKGLALAQREEVVLEDFGVRENRRFHLIGEEGRLLNAKQLGSLVQVGADWGETARTLTLRFPDGALVEGEVELGDRVETSFYGKRVVAGRVVVGPWADALSSFAGRALRLVQPDRPGGGLDRGAGAVTLLSTASLEALRAAAGANGSVDPRRFRMLFGIDGVAAHEEDTWLERRVRIGEATVVPRGNVGRCVVTKRDPDTGEQTLDTLDALAAYRGEAETTEPLPFGVWGEVTAPGRVRLGDEVLPEG
jgi:MOSC domain-containing protein